MYYPIKHVSSKLTVTLIFKTLKLYDIVNTDQLQYCQLFYWYKKMVQVLFDRVIYLFYFDICNFVVAKIASRIQGLRTHSIGTPRTFLRTLSIAECNEVNRNTSPHSATGDFRIEMYEEFRLVTRYSEWRQTLVSIKKTLILYWYVHEKGLSSARISSAKSVTGIFAGDVGIPCFIFTFMTGYWKNCFTIPFQNLLFAE